MIKTVKCFDELWISSDHNPLGFNEELKSSASKLRNSHWKASYYGRVVKALDLRSNGQVSSWVRTPVVAFFLETAVGSEFVTESKQLPVSKWLRQGNVSKNYEFHQITILLASTIKNWKTPWVNSEIPIEKASYYGRVVKAVDLRSNGQVSSWVWTPVVAFFLKTAVGSEFVTGSKQMSFKMIKTVKWFDELRISSDHNPLGFNRGLKSSAIKLKNSHTKSKLLWPSG